LLPKRHFAVLMDTEAPGVVETSIREKVDRMISFSYQERSIAYECSSCCFYNRLPLQLPTIPGNTATMVLCESRREVTEKHVCCEQVSRVEVSDHFS
jgi:hypothetical protein